MYCRLSLIGIVVDISEILQTSSEIGLFLNIEKYRYCL